MFYNTKVLAVILSAAIALATAALSVWVAGAALNDFLTLFLLSLTIVFVLLYVAMEVLFLRKIKHLSGSHSVNGIINDLESAVEEKQREIERLKKLEAFRKDFIADVSHELKTPIFAAQGFVHTLLDGALKEKGVRKKFLKKAAKSLDGLDMLVQDLLTLSQIETGQIKMRFQEIDLYALTTDVFDQLRAKSIKKKIDLRIEGPVREVLAYADWQRMSQVMTNLISNAITYSGSGGEVIVSFSIRKRSVITRVQDFGKGLSKEHIARIFERFYRVDKSRSREKGGTGLGLAIVKHILEGHQSIPEVESTPGKGSTFSFKLPRGKHENIEHGPYHESATG